MDLEYITVAARNLTGDYLRALLAAGYEPNDPRLITFSRPRQEPTIPQVVAHPAPDETDQHEEDEDTDDRS